MKYRGDDDGFTVRFHRRCGEGWRTGVSAGVSQVVIRYVPQDVSLQDRITNEFISLTDLAKYRSDDPTAVIQNWMRSRDVIDFLGLGESRHNEHFNHLEFEGFRIQTSANAYTMSPKK